MKRTLVASWQQSVEKYGQKLAFRTKKKKKWLDYSYKDIDTMARNLAGGLLTLGLKKGTPVGIVSDDRVEWIVTDIACQLVGCPNVPRGSDSTTDEIEYILNHSQATITFVENEKQLEKILSKKSKLKKIKKIIVMDDAFKTNRKAVSIYDLMDKGKSKGKKGLEKVNAISEKIEEADLATIIYTSGTTGVPKGVMLSHGNFMHNVVVITPLIGVNEMDHFLHILPVWHVFGRILEYVAIYSGASAAYTNIRELGADLKDQKPTIMGSAPRLWESIHTKILDGLKKAPPIRKGLFWGSVFVNKIFKKNLRSLLGKRLLLKKPNPVIESIIKIINVILLILTTPFFPLTNLILGKVRAATGGRLRASVSGGGALPLHIDEFFEAVGITVLEGYGLTETSPVIAVRTFDSVIPGCVGPILSETKVQIRDGNDNPLQKGERGVVWVKGPQVMQGYYKNKEATKKALTDSGWFNTGDLGMITFNNTLKLTGRAKDTIVLLGGENAEPVPIENSLTKSEYIKQVMVVGQDQKTLGALIVPETETLKAWLKTHNIQFDKVENELESEVVQKLYADEIRSRVSGQAGFKNFERITGFAFIKKSFEPNDELTAIGKMKRHVISDRYKKEINRIYKA